MKVRYVCQTSVSCISNHCFHSQNTGNGRFPHTLVTCFYFQWHFCWQDIAAAPLTPHSSLSQGLDDSRTTVWIFDKPSTLYLLLLIMEEPEGRNKCLRTHTFHHCKHPSPTLHHNPLDHVSSSPEVPQDSTLTAHILTVTSTWTSLFQTVKIIIICMERPYPVGVRFFDALSQHPRLSRPAGMNWRCCSDRVTLSRLKRELPSRYRCARIGTYFCYRYPTCTRKLTFCCLTRVVTHFSYGEQPPYCHVGIITYIRTVNLK